MKGIAVLAWMRDDPHSVLTEHVYYIEHHDGWQQMSTARGDTVAAGTWASYHTEHFDPDNHLMFDRFSIYNRVAAGLIRNGYVEPWACYRHSGETLYKLTDKGRAKLARLF